MNQCWFTAGVLRQNFFPLRIVFCRAQTFSASVTDDRFPDARSYFTDLRLSRISRFVFCSVSSWNYWLRMCSESLGSPWIVLEPVVPVSCSQFYEASLLWSWPLVHNCWVCRFGCESLKHEQKVFLLWTWLLVKIIVGVFCIKTKVTFFQRSLWCRYPRFWMALFRVRTVWSLPSSQYLTLYNCLNNSDLEFLYLESWCQVGVLLLFLMKISTFFSSEHSRLAIAKSVVMRKTSKTTVSETVQVQIVVFE